MADPEEAGKEARRASPMVPVVVGVVALLAGVGVGAKVVGPRFASGTPSAPDSVVEAPPGEAPRVVRVDNIIVTLTGPTGTRYVILSVAFEVPDEATEQRLHRADMPLRDAIIGVLERESLTSLMQPGAREGLKATLGTLAGRYAPGARITVYIPQFLVQ